MAKLRAPVQLETAFGEYVVDEILGEGGAGRVFGGQSEAGEAVAVKVLTNNSSDKRRRFKNEVAFLARNKHANIVTVIDHGVATHASVSGPFYVMRRYASNLREVLRGALTPERRLQIFAQVLDGVEAAHLQRVVHRDLKPENILCDDAAKIVAIADFGIASFTTDNLATLVETGPHQRLANFQYAAPEQRVAGKLIQETADIYALGLILNELYTGEVPHGTDYKLISAVSKDHAFLDDIVASMLKQNASERPDSLLAVKALIRRQQAEAVSLQKLSLIDRTVIPAGQVDEPLALQPPAVIDVDWNAGNLTLTLDRPVNRAWVDALHNLGNYTSIMGIPPASVRFSENTAQLSCAHNDAQRAIDYFKEWLASATASLKCRLEREIAAEEVRAKESLRRAREAEELRRQVKSTLRF